MSVSEYMSRRPVTAPTGMKLGEAVSLMASKKIGSLVVVRDGEPIGVLTEREIIDSLARYGGIPVDVSVEAAMSSRFARVTPDLSVKDAARVMLSKKGRLLVFEGGRLVGVVTTIDLVRAFSKSQENPPFRDVASMRIYGVDANETAESAIKLMHERRIGSVLVTKRGEPYGIFTERDLLLKVLAKGEKLSRKVGDFATTPLIDIPYESDSREAAKVMVDKNIKRLPLRGERRIVGIVTARDLVEAYSKV